MIKQPIYAAISAALLLSIVIYVNERINFINKGLDTTGTVVKISSYNARCGGRRSRYSCTRFRAHVEYFDLKKVGYVLSIGAGTAGGYDRSNDNADVKIAGKIGIKYDPDNPSKAYENTLWGIWGGPIMLLIVQISTLVTSFVDPKRKLPNY
jgi:hypothetical protein